MIYHEFIGDLNLFLEPGLLLILAVFLSLEWLLFRYPDFQQVISGKKTLIRYGSYIVMTLFMFVFMVNESSTFIYFQF